MTREKLLRAAVQNVGGTWVELDAGSTAGQAKDPRVANVE